MGTRHRCRVPTGREAVSNGQSHSRVYPRAVMRRLSLFLTYATLTIWAVVCLFPLYWMFTLSIKTAPDIVAGPRYIPFVDFWPTVESWEFILFNPTDDTLKRYVNSLIIAFGATGLTLLIGALAAYSLTRLRSAVSWRSLAIITSVAALAGAGILAGVRTWLALAAGAAVFIVLAGTTSRGRRAVSPQQVFLALVITRILPPVAIVLPVYLMIEQMGLLDTRSAVIAAYTAANLPVALWLLRGFVEEIPQEIEDAAQIDGASHWRIFFTMILPLARSGIAASGLLVFILCWNEFLFATYLTTDHALTMPPFLAGQMATREQMASAEPAWGYFSVLIVLMVAPLIFFMGLVQRVISRAGG
jgi:multiple sugar transport system permease protein